MEISNRSLAKTTDILSLGSLALGGILLHFGEWGGLAFIGFGMAHQFYYMPVITMTMKEFLEGKNNIEK